MSDNEPIQKKHLPDDFFEDLEQNKMNKNNKLKNISVQNDHALEQLITVNKVTADKAELVQVYNEHKGNISKTAKALEISRNTLYKRLKEAGIR